MHPHVANITLIFGFRFPKKFRWSNPKCRNLLFLFIQSFLWLQNDIRAEGVVVRPLELPGPDGRPAGPGAVPGDLLPPAPLRPPTPSPRGPQSLPPLLKLHHSGGGHLHPHVQSRSLVSHLDLRTLSRICLSFFYLAMAIPDFTPLGLRQ